VVVEVEALHEISMALGPSVRYFSERSAMAKNGGYMRAIIGTEQHIVVVGYSVKGNFHAFLAQDNKEIPARS
jgi:hypothetical protein